MELKLLLVIFISRVSTRAMTEIGILEEEDQHLRNEALYNDDSEDEDFLNGIDEDLDYFYTYEAIKSLQTMIPKQGNGSNVTTVDMAEKFFLNFLTEEDYDEEEGDYTYEYEDDAMDDLSGSEAKDLDSYNYTELDEIDHDDFLYFDPLEDFEGQTVAAGFPVSRDTILILVAVVVSVLVFLLLLHLWSRRQPSATESDTGSQAAEEKTQAVGNDSLLREIVWNVQIIK